MVLHHYIERLLSQNLLMNKRLLGKKYETLACDYLKNNNYEIIEQNYQCKTGEIDIIARDINDKDKYLCFIEVKFRHTTDYGRAIEAVDERKQQKIIDTSKIYLLQNDISFESNIRYDVICFDNEE